MPSRIDVVATALTASAPVTPRASRTHSQISSQLRSVSKTCEPGTPGCSACDHSRCAIADLVAMRVEHDGPAGAGAGVDREQELVAHVPTASRLMTLTSGAPAARRSISAATISAPCNSVSCVAPPMCGVSTTLSMPEQRMRPRIGALVNDVEGRPGEMA